MAPAKTLEVSSHQGGSHARADRTQVVPRAAWGVCGVLRSAQLSELRVAGGWMGPRPGSSNDHGGSVGLWGGRSTAYLRVPSLLQSGDLGARRPGLGAV